MAFLLDGGFDAAKLLFAFLEQQILGVEELFLLCEEGLLLGKLLTQLLGSLLITHQHLLAPVEVLLTDLEQLLLPIGNLADLTELVFGFTHGLAQIMAFFLEHDGLGFELVALLLERGYLSFRRTEDELILALRLLELALTFAKSRGDLLAIIVELALRSREFAL